MSPRTLTYAFTVFIDSGEERGMLFVVWTGEGKIAACTNMSKYASVDSKTHSI